MQYPGNLGIIWGCPFCLMPLEKGGAMGIKKRGHISEDRMNQCIFRAKNCQMKDDGTWDCSTNLKECFGVHSRE